METDISFIKRTGFYTHSISLFELAEEFGGSMMKKKRCQQSRHQNQLQRRRGRRTKQKRKNNNLKRRMKRSRKVKKSKTTKKKKFGRGIVNSIIDKLPMELHLPGYQYCGEI